jgi:hypothetical protein
MDVKRLKGLKENIIGGIITSLVLILFIQPAYAWRIIALVGGLVHQGYIDRVYSKAGLGDREGYGFIMVFALAMALPLARYFFILRDLPDEGTLARFMHASGKFLLVVSYFILFGIFIVTRKTIDINAFFTRRLTVLAPAISETEYKTLKARWAGMQGKADYDALTAAMEKRAAELGVTLPRVRKP